MWAYKQSDGVMPARFLVYIIKLLLLDIDL